MDPILISQILEFQGDLPEQFNDMKVILFYITFNLITRLSLILILFYITSNLITRLSLIFM